MRPTGRFHLGNYFGAAKNWAELQAADILLVKGDAVPVGSDQDAHIEMARETARRFNRIYGKHFPEPATLRTSTPKILGTDGKQKMSKSLGNIVGVTAQPEVIRKQVLSMVTDTRRVYKSQPGHPRSCNVDSLYKVFFPDDWHDYWELCRKAQMGCLEKKQILAERIIETFAPFREARAELSDDAVKGILARGSERAREVAGGTVTEARQAIGLLPPL